MHSKYKIKIKGFFLIGFLYIGLGSCSKLVEVPDPVTTVTTEATFASDATAVSAMMGIYNDLVTGHSGGNGYRLSYANGLITINAGLSADELQMSGGASPFETNTLNLSNFPGIDFWNYPYFNIYQANAAIDGLAASTGVTAATRNQLTGEAKFLRAFCYFYLVNLFGDVPLALTTAYATNSSLPRTSTNKVFQQIIGDLKDAVSLLPDNYSISNEERTRANKSAANALLARAYLYSSQWTEAEAAATAVISNSNFLLLTDLNQVFLANSQEAILQWQLQQDIAPYSTREGLTFLPGSNTSPPEFYFTTHFLSSFEAGDLRKLAWVDSSDVSGDWFHYPKKYKIKVGSEYNVLEYPMVLRLAEQYLIRAEARAQQNNLSGAISDLNVIRQRAGLTNLSSSLTQSQVISAVMQERRIELMAEWGHRWLDLKRTGQADALLSTIKPTWQSFQKLYPIPSSELINDANLTQNPGY
jgi:starch-binding outer membrane protein, SusD/RagB family